MDLKELLQKLNIKYIGSYDNNAYVIDLPNSKVFGDIFTLLDTSDLIDILESNQVVTEQGSSLLYEVKNEPYLLNLLADWESDQYQLIINNIK